MDQKFSVLDDFRQQAQERGLPLTLSMGISLVRLSMIKSGKLLCRTLILHLFEAEIKLLLRKMMITRNFFILEEALSQQLSVLVQEQGL